ncbi:protein abrupt-like isoform X4 [Pseudomyrmex gracilis]|uniref:protein abrupt-like isoform X4 n=1 Tax=Pseudomyrmex gracilis TaxID=219809 RepID=UPI0009953CC9|nr:protein abrupt-like isoform X4 [Pseudomyrmex gracilis]
MAASSSLSSAGETQQYALKWNDFHTNILSTFRNLRDEEDFVDVTLACDNCSFTAHKVVLSACSPYFRQLLKANPCQHPIIILRDVSSQDMESLLRFMYHGEVHVAQEQLPAFLKTAHMLKVKGLAEVSRGAGSAKTPAPSSSTGNNASAPATPRNPWQDKGDLSDNSPPEKRPRSYSPPNHVDQKTDLQESLLGQALEGGPTIHTPANNIQSTGEDSNSMSENDEEISNNDSILNTVKAEPSDILNDSVEHHRNSFPAALLSLQGIMPGPSGMHVNQDAAFGSTMSKREEAAMAAAATDTTQTVENFARHLYTALRHDDARPVCRYCGRSYSSPSNLRQHVKNVHSNWPPPETWPQCNVCGKRCKTKHYLINHQLQAHGIHQRPSMNNPAAQQQQQQQQQYQSSSSLP